ncbi:MAG: hypothetical protein AAFO69_16690, partial [Bacteroidota bacterium]
MFKTQLISSLLWMMAFALPLSTITAQADQNSAIAAASKGLSLRSIGPAFMGGRIADIAVSPHHASTWYVAAGSGNLWKTTNSGITWQAVFDHQSSYSIGTVTVDPNHPETVWVGTGENVSGRHVGWGDGIYKSQDGGKTWRFVQNLPVAQLYHINVDNEFPYNVYGGMQDNGSWGGPAYVLKAQGIRNSYWQELAFGDGFDVVPDPDDSRYGYAMSQQGFVSRYDRVTGYNHNIRPTHPDPEVRLRFNWNAAIAQDPFDNNTIYFGSQFVHKSENKGNTWTVISPDLTTNDPAKQKQDESGGLTMDATGAENHTTILSISPSPVDRNVIWAGTDDGLVQLTRDGGKTWTKVNQNMPGMPSGAWIPQIKVSNKTAGEALVVVNDYRRYNYEPYAYRTRNYGQTWERIVDSNDVFGYTLSIIQDPEEPNLLFLGTDDGLYVSIDGAGTWTKWTNGYPSVSTKDLVIHPREHDLVIGTFGRAAYVLDDIRPLRAMAKNNRITEKPITIFSPPSGVLVQAFQQPSGTRFGADGLYNGENRRGGAMISYYFQQPKKDSAPTTTDNSKKKKKGKKAANPAPSPAKSDSVKVSYDSLHFTFYRGNELIRTIKFKAPKEEGLNRMYWQMDEKGV